VILFDFVKMNLSFKKEGRMIELRTQLKLHVRE